MTRANKKRQIHESTSPPYQENLGSELPSSNYQQGQSDKHHPPSRREKSHEARSYRSYEKRSHGPQSYNSQNSGDRSVNNHSVAPMRFDHNKVQNDSSSLPYEKPDIDTFPQQPLVKSEMLVDDIETNEPREVIEISVDIKNQEEERRVGLFSKIENSRPMEREINWCDGMSWNDMTHLQRIRRLIPRLQPEKGDDSYYRAVLPTVKKPPSDRRITKMRVAVQAAKEAVSRLYRKLSQDIQSDSENSSGDGWSSSDDNRAPCILGITEEDAHTFIENLPNHLLFTTSFDVDGTDTSQSKLCLCPCSSKKSREWQNVFRLSDLASTDACHKTFEHFALLSHLEIKGEVDPLHLGTRAYLLSLYSNHYGIGNNGFGLDHEALYQNKRNMNHLYKEVMAFKHRVRENQLADLRNEIKNWREKHDRLNVLTEEQRKALEQRRTVFDELGLTGEEKPADELPTAMISKIRSHYRSFLKTILRSYNIDEDKEDKDGFDEWIESDDIPQPVNVNELFRKWSAKEKWHDKSYLFRDLCPMTCSKLLHSAQWNFQGQASREEYDDDKGFDKGGLTRTFLQSVWDQIGDLSIMINGYKLKLFEREAGGIVPIPDDIIRATISRRLAVSDGAIDSSNEGLIALNKVRVYYRAIGRLMIHSLVTGHVLPSGLIPHFYRAYFFCDCRPGDGISYATVEKKQLLFGFIEELGFTNLSGFVDYDFMQLLDEQLVEKRSIALTSMLDGLILAEGRWKTAERVFEGLSPEGTIHLRDFFFDRSIQLVNEILFSPEDVTAEAVISNLKGKILLGNTYTDQLNSVQQRFMNLTLPNLLRRKEKEENENGTTTYSFAMRFLKYVTGLGFINRNKLGITICFLNINESSRPQAHTCEQELDIPLQAYNCNEDVLEKFLEEAFLYSMHQAITAA